MELSAKMKNKTPYIKNRGWFALTVLTVLSLSLHFWQQIKEADAAKPKADTVREIDKQLFPLLAEILHSSESYATYTKDVAEVDRVVQLYKKDWDAVPVGMLSTREKIVFGDYRDALKRQPILIERLQRAFVADNGHSIAISYENPDTRKTLSLENANNLWKQREPFADELISQFGSVNPEDIEGVAELILFLLTGLLWCYVLAGSPLPRRKPE
jgi:hypothetical protein